MPGEDHYFSPRPESAVQHHSVVVPAPAGPLTLRTTDGTFSPRRLDPGTEVLLGCLPDIRDLPPGPLLDVGCGYGAIALSVASSDPTRTVWAVDVNERAVADCRHNAATLGLDVRAGPPDSVPAALRFAAVCSNPPIRIGKVALHALLDQWLTRLQPDGTAWLVVQRHLGADSLAAHLRGEGWEVDRVRSRRGYRVLEVRRPAAGGHGEPGRLSPS